MQYMLLIYLDEQALSESQRASCYEESTHFAQQLNASGKYLAAAPLHPTSTATSVRMRDGKRMITDGPFAETKEVIGGFFLLTCETREQAIDIARECPAAQWATIEVRELGPCFA